MRIISGFHIREILDEIIAVPTGEAAVRLSGIIGLNPVGRFLFEELQSEHTEQTLIAALMAEYEVEQETAEADVREFLDNLRSSQLLEE